MFHNIFKVANPVATGAGYAIIMLVAASLVDALIDTNLSANFDRISYRSIMIVATIYCFYVSVSLSIQRKKIKQRGENIEVFVIDRVLSFWGFCIAIGGLPAYTQANPVPFYVALLGFALVAVSLAFILCAFAILRKVKGSVIPQVASLVVLSLSCIFLIAAFAAV